MEVVSSYDSGDWDTWNVSISPSYSELEALQQLTFTNQCFTIATEQNLCENTAVVVDFGCAFPGNISTMNAVNHFTAVEISHIVATSLAFVVAFTGNLLVVATTPFDATLRSPITLFLVNLSLADILVSVVCLWDNAIRSLSYNYILGPYICKAGGFIHMTCLLVSVLTLAGIAIDRVYAVLLPLKARLTPPRPKWVVGIIWLLSIAAAAPFSALREYRVYKWADTAEIQCTYSRGRGIFDSTATPRCHQGTNYVNLYHIFVTVLLFFIPVIVILLAYFLIILRLWRSSFVQQDYRIASKVHMDAKKKVVRLALVVLLAFIVCWTPLQVLILMTVFGNTQAIELSSERHSFWIYFLAYMNSALNPIIYGGFSKSYRATLFKILRKGRKRKYSSMLNGRSRGGTVSMSIPQRSEVLSLRLRQERNDQNSFREQHKFISKSVKSPLELKTPSIMETDLENQEEKNLEVEENMELKITIQSTIPNGHKIGNGLKSSFLNSIRKTDLSVENVSIVETVLIKKNPSSDSIENEVINTQT